MAGAPSQRCVEHSLLTAPVTALAFCTPTTLAHDSSPPSASAPVTARPYLLAAVGNQLHVFRDPHGPVRVIKPPAAAAAAPQVFEVFPPGVAIHAITAPPASAHGLPIVVHGARFVALIDFVISSSPSFVSDNDQTLETTPALTVRQLHQFPDWVFATAWLLPSKALAVAAGHATVFVAPPNSPLSDAVPLPAPPRELIWSAALLPSLHPTASPTQLRCLAGSSFGAILQWSLSLPSFVAATTTASEIARTSNAQTALAHQSKSSSSASLPSPPVQRLAGHAGAVTHIVVTPDYQRMLSASVDRSVRVWRAISSKQPNHPQSFVPLVVHYGHHARVWAVAFAGPGPEAPVLSAGEDRTVRAWRSDAPGQLAVLRGHTGRNVWCLAVDHGENGDKSESQSNGATPCQRQATSRVVSGGEDGAIIMRDIPNAWFSESKIESSANSLGFEHHVHVKQSGYQENTAVATSTTTTKQKSNRSHGPTALTAAAYQLPDNLPNPRKVGGGAADEGARALIFLSSDRVLLSTDFGRLLGARIPPTIEGADGIPIQWKKVYRDSLGVAFTPCSLSRHGAIVFAGRTDGRVVVLRACSLNSDWTLSAEDTYDVALINAFGDRNDMVCAVFSRAGPNGDDVDLFVSAGSGELFHWHVTWPQHEKIVSTFVGTYRPERLTKNTLVTAVCTVSCGDVIVTGNKAGRVSAFLRPNIGNCVEDGTKSGTPKVVLPSAVLKVHDDRVSEVQVLTTHLEGHEMKDLADVEDSDSDIVDANTHADEDNFEEDDNSNCQRNISRARFSTRLRLGVSKNVLMTAGFDGHVTKVTVEQHRSGDKGSNLSLHLQGAERRGERADTIVRILRGGNGHTIGVAAFRGAALTIWDAKREVELARVNTGNWRRAHDVHMGDSAYGNENSSFGGICAAFWRGGRLHVAQTKGLGARGTTLLRSALHGGRANDVTWLVRPGKAGMRQQGGKTFVAKKNDMERHEEEEEGVEVMTAGEDTAVMYLKARTTGWKEAQRLTGHTSGVAGVAIAEHGWMLSVGGKDTAIVWRRKCARKNGKQMEPVNSSDCNTPHPGEIHTREVDKGEEWALRRVLQLGMELEKSGKANTVEAESERSEALLRATTVTKGGPHYSLCGCTDEEGCNGNTNCNIHSRGDSKDGSKIGRSGCECVTWTVGRSDGSVVSVHAGESDSNSECIVRVQRRGRHRHGAVLCSAATTQSIDGMDQTVVVSGDSGGGLCLWWNRYDSPINHTENDTDNDKRGNNQNEMIEWIAHEGGVGAVAVQVTRPATKSKKLRRIVVVSGGDDERVCVSVDGQRVWRADIGMAHSAAVTGVCLVEDLALRAAANTEAITKLPATALFMSVGADQRVVLWEVKVAGEVGNAADGGGESEMGRKNSDLNTQKEISMTRAQAHVRRVWLGMCNVADLGGVCAATVVKRKRLKATLTSTGTMTVDEGGSELGIVAVVVGCGVEKLSITHPSTKLARDQQSAEYQHFIGDP